MRLLLKILAQTKKAIAVFLLAFALVSVQGAQLHVHIYDHFSDSSGHSHHNGAHFNYDITGAEHADEVAEVEFSQQGFTKSLVQTSMVIALFAVLVLLCLPLILSRRAWRIPCYILLTFKPFSLTPPLRAPPH